MNFFLHSLSLKNYLSSPFGGVNSYSPIWFVLDGTNIRNSAFSFFYGGLKINSMTSKSIFTGFLSSTFVISSYDQVFSHEICAIFVDSVFRANTTTGNGGAILVSNACANLTCYKCEFIGCRANIGGAIYSTASKSAFQHICFSECIGSFRGQSYYIDCEHHICEQSSIYRCSFIEQSGAYCSIDMFNAQVTLKNINVSHCYVNRHVTGFLVSSVKKEDFRYINIDSCDSPEGATLYMDSNPTVCNLTYGNVINCPVKQYGLIFTYLRYNIDFSHFVFYNNTGGIYCVANSASFPRFFDSLFDCDQTIIKSSSLYSCQFNVIGTNFVINAPNIDRCLDISSQTHHVSKKSYFYILLFFFIL